MRTVVPTFCLDYRPVLESVGARPGVRRSAHSRDERVSGYQNVTLSTLGTVYLRSIPEGPVELILAVINLYAQSYRSASCPSFSIRR